MLAKRQVVVWLAGLIVAVNGFFPAVWILFTSLKTESELMTFPITYLPLAPTLANYYQAFTEQPLPRFLLNSFIVASLSTALCVLVSALCGLCADASPRSETKSDHGRAD